MSRLLQFRSVLLVVPFLFSISHPILAQFVGSYVTEGYINKVESPTAFEVSNCHVTLTPKTTYGDIETTLAITESPLRSHILLGAYVKIYGKRNSRTKTVTANTVLLREDWKNKLKGLGVIDKVIASGPQTLLSADGYRIEITPKTQITYVGDLHTLSDINANLWIRYEGLRNPQGLLIAQKATFFPAKPTHFKALKGVEIYDLGFEPPHAPGATASSAPAETQNPDADLTGQQPGKVHLGAWRKSHDVPADTALQQRIARIGARLIPAYQRDLAENDPTKIHFRFYAVDDAKARDDIGGLDGLVLVPQTVVARMQNDDQLAAILADGIAAQLQRQTARVVKNSRILTGMELTGDIAQFAVPGLGIATSLTSLGVGHQENIAFQEERCRVALALMSNAGFDILQAPEAWRRLGPRHLPTNDQKLAQLPYPDRSGYMLNIIGLQYQNTTAIGSQAQQDLESTASTSDQ